MLVTPASYLLSFDDHDADHDHDHGADYDHGNDLLSTWVAG